MRINRRDHIKTLVASTFQLSRWTTPTLTAVVLPVHAQTSCETFEIIRIKTRPQSSPEELNLDFEFTGDGCNTSIVSPSISSPDIQISFEPDPNDAVIIGLFPFVIRFDNQALKVSVTGNGNPRTTNLGMYTSQSGNMFNVISVLTIDQFSDGAFFTAKIILESK